MISLAPIPNGRWGTFCPIGTAQRVVLSKLVENGGSWYAGCSWSWEASRATERILNSLQRRGLVYTHEEIRKRRPVTVYSITSIGRDMTMETTR